MYFKGFLEGRLTLFAKVLRLKFVPEHPLTLLCGTIALLCSFHFINWRVRSLRRNLKVVPKSPYLETVKLGLQKCSPKLLQQGT